MTKRSLLSRLSTLAAGALLTGLPATAALAAEPITAADARAMAQESRDKAEMYSSWGGVGYKSGKVQAAEADAAKYDALANQLATPPAAAVPAQPQPESSGCLTTKPSVQPPACDNF